MVLLDLMFHPSLDHQKALEQLCPTLHLNDILSHFNLASGREQRGVQKLSCPSDPEIIQNDFQSSIMFHPKERMNQARNCFFVATTPTHPSFFAIHHPTQQRRTARDCALTARRGARGAPPIQSIKDFQESNTSGHSKKEHQELCRIKENKDHHMPMTVYS